MKLLIVITFLLSVISANAAATAAVNSTETPLFYLKTFGATHPEHEDLYVYGYHRGAGLSDAVLTKEAHTASPAFMNGTHIQFAINTPFPWGMVMHLDNNYAAWEPVMINAGYGSDDFFSNSTGLQWSLPLGFGGWLVCDWYHNGPQLFYINQFRPHMIPEDCSEVALEREAFDS